MSSSFQSCQSINTLLTSNNNNNHHEISNRSISPITTGNSTDTILSNQLNLLISTYANQTDTLRSSYQSQLSVSQRLTSAQAKKIASLRKALAQTKAENEILWDKMQRHQIGHKKVVDSLRQLQVALQKWCRLREEEKVRLESDRRTLASHSQRIVQEAEVNGAAIMQDRLKSVLSSIKHVTEESKNLTF